MLHSREDVSTNSLLPIVIFTCAFCVSTAEAELLLIVCYFIFACCNVVVS